MAKSFYHMTHENGEFPGDRLYFSNKGTYKKGGDVVVISGENGKHGIDPFLEGIYTVSNIEENSEEYNGKKFGFKASLNPKNVPASPLSLKERKEIDPDFIEYQNFSRLVSKSDYDYFKSLINGDNQDINYESSVLIDVSELLIGNTEISREIMSRLGQGKFRKDVARVWNNRAEVCAVTLIDMTALLNASHIVPWKDCVGEKEPWRLDGANGILLCAHYDRLFDRHLITFERRGLSCPIKFSKLITKNIKLTLGLSDDTEVTPNQMSPDDLKRFQKYLNIHNETFFELEKQRSN
jgi:hypothetical protein